MKVCAITGSSGVLGKKALKMLPFKFLKFRGKIESYKAVKIGYLKIILIY